MDIKSIAEAKKIIAERRQISLEKIEQAKALCLQNEKYKELDRQIKLNTLAISRALAQGKDTKELEKNDKLLNSKLNKLQDKLLAGKSFYHCPICNDTGFVDGKYCSCLTDLYKQILRQKSGANELPLFTFADNKIADINCKQTKDLSTLYNSMQRYCDSFPNTSVKNILLCGKVGIGKSCLLSATLNSLLDKGVNCQYFSAFHLNSIFLKYHTTDIKEREHFFENLIGADVLIIDDLGTEPIIKNVSIEYLTTLLNERHNKHTIIATNLTLQELQNKYGDRVFSRITNKETTRLLYLDGDDLRHFNK